MMCYKDITFCKSDCTNTACGRYLSSKTYEDADKLGLPIAIADFSTDCPDYLPLWKEKKDEDT